MAEYVYAAATVFVADPRSPGETMMLHENEPYATDEMIVIARPDLFVSEPPRAQRANQPPIESTTAAPGERRNARRA